MYADRVTDSMQRAISETDRRRAKQVKFNEEHGITPVSIHKSIRDLTDQFSAGVSPRPAANTRPASTRTLLRERRCRRSSPNWKNR